MDRKQPFVKNEYYHLYTRGVEKRKIFMSNSDYDRFSALLYLVNQNNSIDLKNLSRNKKIGDLFKEKREGQLVSILNYSLMPNHFHLIIQENEEGGISKFMMKLLTAYSMYFNIKYKRSGPLFVRPFRSKHIDEENYLLYVFYYVHLNPLEIFERNWKEDGIKDKVGAYKFLSDYEYGAFQDFVFKNKKGKRPKSSIIDFEKVPEFSIDTTEVSKMFDFIRGNHDEGEPFVMGVG